MHIKLSDLAIVNRQRKTMDPARLQQLAESIRNTGRLIHPINIRPRRPDDVYPPDFPTESKRGQPVIEPWILLTGGRRTAAHYLLGKTEIEARNYEDLPPLEQAIVELEENLGREDLNPLDELAAKHRIYTLRSEQGQTLTAIADEIGVDKGNLSKELRLYEEVKKDPNLQKQTTKRAMQRALDHKREIERRISTIKMVDVGDLKSRLFTADARDWLRAQPANSAHIFSDPPWGIDYKSASKIDTKNGTAILGDYDDGKERIKDIITDCIPEMVRILRPDGWMVLFFATDEMLWLADLVRNACKIHGEYREHGRETCLGASNDALNSPCKFLSPTPLPWIWYRPNSRNISQWPDRYAKHVYESILVVNGGKARFVLQNRPDVLVFDTIYGDRYHEMQKPHDLCKEIVSRISVIGERIIDPFFGSGALLAAAADLARDFSGCDLNPQNLGSATALIGQYYKGKAATDAVAAGRKAAEARLESLELTDAEAESIQ